MTSAFRTQDRSPGSLILSGERWDVLRREFFDRPALTVAPKLLGCELAHETSDGHVAAEIVEVEAYRGESDPASHAFRGKTARNAVMFGEPGHAYVYFTYGMHFCVNLVCQRPGEAAAVLLRAGRVVDGVELAAKRRAARPAAAERELARGPARLCQALAIDRAENGADVCDPASPLRVLGRGVRGSAGFDGLPARAISSGPRVGVRLGADEPWRFWITGEPAVSAYRPHMPKRRLSAVTRGSGFAPAALGNLSRRAEAVGGSMQR
ncbi:MAG: DNA-3-methyladenine glycosylase [Nocardiopsaceae bacterium]|jgi:DNA-3-methyladenine glycosylase|nr:DNA-3-methyladenine glycosylase [Nocardiopsaceae bacterium]